MCVRARARARVCVFGGVEGGWDVQGPWLLPNGSSKLRQLVGVISKCVCGRAQVWGWVGVQ